MRKDFTHPILQKPIRTLNVSNDSLPMAEANGYKTLDEMVKKNRSIKFRWSRYADTGYLKNC